MTKRPARSTKLVLSVLLGAAGWMHARDAWALACVTTVDCISTPATPVCDPQSHLCVACLVDYTPTVPPPLSCPTPALPACQRSGVLLGQCTECSGSNSTRCSTTDKPVCNLVKGDCGCVSDGDCGTKTGRICDVTKPPAGACVPGCRVVGGVDSCPVGQSCSAQDGGTGTCVTTTCQKDQDCTPPAPKCDLGTVPGHCVQCIVDTDCSGGLVCDTSPGPGHGQCVECAPGKTGNCKLPKQKYRATHASIPTASIFLTPSRTIKNGIAAMKPTSDNWPIVCRAVGYGASISVRNTLANP